MYVCMSMCASVCWIEDGPKFFDTPAIERWGPFALLLNLGGS